QGGKGADTFLFDTRPGIGGIASIDDFGRGADRIALAATVFDALVPGKLAASAFALGDAASDGLDRVLYDPAGGLLRYDPDGDGAADAIVFGSLAAGLSMSHRDFIVLG
ncbi:MAG: calcium-binding protein, partial [Rhizobiales bacterium]|nr:calcium-binding protein [Hyphomicrobiales bacterium]